MINKNHKIIREIWPNARPIFLFREDFYDIRFYPSNTSRFAIVIGKKAVKKAHDRNRVKRFYYDKMFPLFKDKNYMIILNVKKDIMGNNLIISQSLANISNNV